MKQWGFTNTAGNPPDLQLKKKTINIDEDVCDPQHEFTMNLSLLSAYQELSHWRTSSMVCLFLLKRQYCSNCNPIILCVLSILHLFSNLITEDLGPVHLATGDWQLSA